jgi:hypothetical protein
VSVRRGTREVRAEELNESGGGSIASDARFAELGSYLAQGLRLAFLRPAFGELYSQGQRVIGPRVDPDSRPAQSASTSAPA